MVARDLLAPLPRGKASERQLTRLKLYEVSLEPKAGFGFAAKNNGLQDDATLGDYSAPQRYPNIALLRVPVPVNGWRQDTEKEKSLLQRFQRQRAVLHVPELIVQWLSFVWGVGGTGNPLLQGHGLPSAAMIEVFLSAAGYDITPGLGDPHHQWAGGLSTPLRRKAPGRAGRSATIAT